MHLHFVRNNIRPHWSTIRILIKKRSPPKKILLPNQNIQHLYLLDAHPNFSLCILPTVQSIRN